MKAPRKPKPPYGDIKPSLADGWRRFERVANAALKGAKA